MKTIRLTILFLFFTLPMFGQTLTGLWTGALSNDSNTVRRDESFEIALTQYKDKVYGFSRSTFIVNDTLYYIVKRVGGTIEGDVCEVEDEKIVAHNFPTKPEKGVKVISTFRRNPVDSTWSMDGEWKTKRTKKYYSISGKIQLKEETNYEQSKIFPHLEELGIAEDVAFYKEAKNAPTSITADRNTLSSVDTKTDPVLKDKLEPVNIPVKSEGIAKARTEYPQDKAIAKTEKQNIESKPVVEEKVVSEPEIVAVKKEQVAKNQTSKAPLITNTNPATNNTKPKVKEENKIVQQEKKQAAVPVVKKDEIKVEPAIVKKTEKEDQPTITKNIEKPVEQPKNEGRIAGTRETIIEKAEVASPLVAKVAERKMAVPQMLTFRSDSLLLSLYDNGEVDGDTVSVLLNGEVILAKQGLKASAIRKTIYVPRGTHDSLTLVLFAENLGRYPPNTGLLVVHDGDDVYQIRFSADLNQNATVIFKRRIE